jgi:DNA-3-methyladenine glycosylase
VVGVGQRSKNKLRGELLKRAYFEAPPERVARRLLGKVLARRTRSGWMAGRIVEVEAYLGPHRQPADPAAHAHRGPTPRNQVLFGPAGRAYVYSIYGRYFCMNVSCEREGRAGSVLLRALEPVAGLEQMARNRGLSGFPPFSQTTRKGWGTDERRDTGRGPGCEPGRELTSGPGRLCQALGITRSADNGLDLLDPKSSLQLRDDGTRAGRVLVTARIGIRHAVELPLRFALAGNGCVSGPKSMGRACIVPHSHAVIELIPKHLPESAQRP